MGSKAANCIFQFVSYYRGKNDLIELFIQGLLTVINVILKKYLNDYIYKVNINLL